MILTELLEHQTLKRDPDLIDEIAALEALRIVEAEAESIISDKPSTLVNLFDELNKQFAGRRIVNRVDLGNATYESTTFATRTVDCSALDEIFTVEIIYDPTNEKAPSNKYTVQMMGADGEKTIVILDCDGTMKFIREIDGNSTVLEGTITDRMILELYRRARNAFNTYEIRKAGAINVGLDPRVYSDVADMDARSKLLEAGYADTRSTSLE